MVSIAPTLRPGPTPARYRHVLGRFPSGVAVITTLDSCGPTGFSCQSFAALSLDPPLVVFAPSRSSETWPRIAASGTFCVNVLHQDQLELCRVFARKGADRFGDISWRPGLTGSPILSACAAWIDCEVADVFDGGDHLVVTGRVLDLDTGRGGPLVFHSGGFHRLAPIEGA